MPMRTPSEIDSAKRRLKAMLSRKKGDPSYRDIQCWLEWEAWRNGSNTGPVALTLEQLERAEPTGNDLFRGAK